MSPRPSLSRLKGSRLRVLVRISAMLSSEETFSTEIFPFWTLSRRKWCRISICLVRECRTGFLLRSMAPLLSQRTAKTYSASMVEMAREVCLLENHDSAWTMVSTPVPLGYHNPEKRLEEIIEWDLLKQMDSQSFNIFAEIAYDCLNEDRLQRPYIDEIIMRLEKVLELQLEHQNAIMSSHSKEFTHLRIPLDNILSATNNFSYRNVIGEDCSEKRYKGQLLWSGELFIHAGRLHKEWKDVAQQFWMEISMLSNLKHKNLVSLVGFCDENDERIIIYKYNSMGSLSNYLSDPILLTWVRRLEISDFVVHIVGINNLANQVATIGIAQALSYIHFDESRDFSVIHRRISSNAVLLDDDWEPKLSFSGYSMKIKASQRHNSFYATSLRGIYGHGDPTYIATKRFNHKSDMYSFGIVLFEVLCGRSSISDGQDNKYLGPMAIFHYKKNTLDEIIDPVLRKQMDQQSFDVFAKTAYDCLNEERSRRPDISEVVTRLENALKLQMEHQNDEHSTVAAEVEVTSSSHDKVIISLVEMYAFAF
nr:protein kinase-like domain, phloem protein 2-like protein [Tanacetum cinerariifolium]